MNAAIRAHAIAAAERFGANCRSRAPWLVAALTLTMLRYCLEGAYDVQVPLRLAEAMREAAEDNRNSAAWPHQRRDNAAIHARYAAQCDSLAELLQAEADAWPVFA